MNASSGVPVIALVHSRTGLLIVTRLGDFKCTLGAMAGDGGAVTDLPGHGPRCRIAVVATPRASRTVVDGLHDGALRIRLAAPPVEGAANQALCRFLADRLGVPMIDVTVARGHYARRKLIHVHGIDAVEARSRLGLLPCQQRGC